MAWRTWDDNGNEIIISDSDYEASKGLVDYTVEPERISDDRAELGKKAYSEMQIAQQKAKEKAIKESETYGVFPYSTSAQAMDAPFLEQYLYAPIKDVASYPGRVLTGTAQFAKEKYQGTSPEGKTFRQYVGTPSEEYQNAIAKSITSPELVPSMATMYLMPEVALPQRLLKAKPVIQGVSEGVYGAAAGDIATGEELTPEDLALGGALGGALPLAGSLKNTFGKLFSETYKVNPEFATAGLTNRGIKSKIRNQIDELIDNAKDPNSITAKDIKTIIDNATDNEKFRRVAYKASGIEDWAKTVGSRADIGPFGTTTKYDYIPFENEVTVADVLKAGSKTRSPGKKIAMESLEEAYGMPGITELYGLRPKTVKTSIKNIPKLISPELYKATRLAEGVSEYNPALVPFLQNYLYNEQ